MKKSTFHVQLLVIIGILLAGNIVFSATLMLGPSRVLAAVEYRIEKYLGISLDESIYIPKNLVVGDSITKDPHSVFQWGLRMLLDGADYWDVQGSAPRDVVVAVIDKGIHTQHEDLRAQSVSGYNFIDNTTELRIDDDYYSPNSSINHGLCAASIIAAEVGNGIGMAGAFHRALIMPLQSDGHIAEAIHYAVANGAEVIHIAGGGGDYLYPMYNNSKELPKPGLYSDEALSGIREIKSALQAAYAENVPVITGVGNTRSFGMTLLADDDTTISVAPHNIRGEVSEHTSFSYSFDIFAPGGSRKRISNLEDFEPIWPGEFRVGSPNADYDDPICAVGENEYSFLTLGSGAMPHISGTVALIKSYLPGSDIDEIKNILRISTVPLTPAGSLLEGLSGRISLAKVRQEIDRRLD